MTFKLHATWRHVLYRINSTYFYTKERRGWNRLRSRRYFVKKGLKTLINKTFTRVFAFNSYS